LRAVGLIKAFAMCQNLLQGGTKKNFTFKNPVTLFLQTLFPAQTRYI
jgi:hypothetical protein